MNFSVDKPTARQHFAKAAARYDDCAVIQREIGQRLFDRLDYMRIEPTAIVDLGSGTGYFSNALSKRFFDAKIIAVDSAEAMLTVHQRRNECGGSVEFLCADMEMLPLQDNSVDLVFANLSVHWASQLSDVFSECQRILRPEGLLLFSTLGPKSFYELRASFAEVDDHPHVHAFHDMHQIGDALMKTRFYQPVVDRESLEMTHDDVMSILRDLQGTGVQNVDVDRQRGLMGKGKLQKMMSAYEQFKTVDGRYPVHYEVVYGQAWAVARTPNFETHIAADSIPFRHKPT